MPVSDGRDVADRFVQRDVIPRRPCRDRLPVHSDLLRVGIDQRARRGDDLAIDADSTRRDKLLGVPSRRYAAGGERFLQTLFHIAILPEGGQRRPAQAETTALSVRL
jgi:hypothetical protein